MLPELPGTGHYGKQLTEKSRGELGEEGPEGRPVSAGGSRTPPPPDVQGLLAVPAKP